jgi:transcriptional antiterminator Rof (Rho-off)
MGHRIDRCDFLDVFEEAVVKKSAVTVELRDGKRLTDHVRDVVTEDGEDFAVLHAHGRVSLHAVSHAEPAERRQPTYAGKLGQ